MPRERVSVWKKQVTAMLAVTAFGSVGLASPARAVFSSGSYSHSSSACNNSVDPITHVIYGFTAYYAVARSQVQNSMGWYADSSTDQYANSAGSDGVWHCTQMDGEVYSKPEYLNRDHERLNQTHERDAVGRYETVGTPHHDTVTWPGCGVLEPKHIADDYNGPRNRILNGMSDHGFAYSWQYWGNTQPQHQCNGSYTSADGWVGWSNIG